jgi:hypothetical protein
MAESPERRPAHIEVIVDACRNWWDAWVELVLINLIWVFSWFTVILGPPATFGMYHVTNRLAHGEALGVPGLVEGARRYFLQSWRWFVLNLVVLGLAGTNIWFYGRFAGIGARFLQFLFAFLGLSWLLVQFYALPYLIEQNEKRLRLAFRNALFTALGGPGFTTMVAGTAFFVAVLSLGMVVPLLLGGPCLVASLGSHAVLERIETFEVRERDAKRQQARQDEPPEDEDTA